MNAAVVVDCTFERHAGAILDIYNEAIVHSTALWEYQPRAAETMLPWFDSKVAHGYPVVGLESPHGELLAFGTWGPWRDRPAYRYTVEHSVYVHHAHRGHGLGVQVMNALIERVPQHPVHAMVGAVEAGNQASLALHARLGFVPVCTMRQVGYKFGRWLDLTFVQRTFTMTTEPHDG